MMKYTHTTIALLVFLLISTSGFARREHTITGKTMGTTYQVQVISDRDVLVVGLAERIQQRLFVINRSMSTYIEDSEISRFNRFEKVQAPFAVSEDFLRVMLAGKKIFELSEGAWDASVAPLVELWGFGFANRKTSIPPTAQLQTALASVGYSKIEIQTSGHLVKKVEGLSLDFGSIAKGFGVDQVAAEVRAAGYKDFLVEIGGEIIASGVRADRLP